MEPGSTQATVSGARQGAPTWLRRLTARATARDLAAFVVPDARLARAAGLDLAAAGLGLAATPRHASVLLLAGDLPAGLAGAATVVYAQMPRPRAILALGAEPPTRLPAADVVAPLDQSALVAAVDRLRQQIVAGAWAPDVPSFDGVTHEETTDAPAMNHAGMDHSPAMHDAKAAANAEGPNHEAHAGHHHAGHEHPAAPNTAHADHGASGRTVGHQDHGSPPPEHHGDAHDAASPESGTEPAPGQHHHDATAGNMGAAAGHSHGHSAMHAHQSHHAADHAMPPADDSPSQHDQMRHAAMGHHTGEPTASGHHTPPSGPSNHTMMDHATPMDHHAMDHGGMDHGDHMAGGFMSMVAMTRDLPRSRDGLPMEWIEAPFGPLFPGLPGGLALTLTLDGDGVARAAISGGVVARDLAATWPGPANDFPTQLARLDPLAPVAYRDLAWRALEAATGIPVDDAVARARIGAAEQERAASHLGWLAALGYLLGDAWLAERAAGFQLALVRATSEGEIARLRPAIDAFGPRVTDFPPIQQRLAGIGNLYRTSADAARGPVARARGLAEDARTNDAIYQALGFTPRVDDGGDALACLRVRLAEITESLELVQEVGALGDLSGPAVPDDATGEGMATVETPRGTATLHLELEHGMVTAVHLDTPSTHLASLVPALAEQLEVADALVVVAALDLSPWEMDR